MMDFAGKAKWGAWNEVKGLDADTAKSQYVEYFVSVLDRAGNPEAQKIKDQVRLVVSRSVPRRASDLLAVDSLMRRVLGGLEESPR